MSVSHPKTSFLRFILGGRDANRYPGFNGLFTRVMYSDKVGAFIDAEKDLAKLEKLYNDIPSSTLDNLYNREIVSDQLDVKFDGNVKYT